MATTNAEDTINGIELIVKGMASQMKSMQASLGRSEAALITMKTRVTILETSMTTLKAKVSKLERIMDTLVGASGISNADEAAKPAFQAICKELLWLVRQYCDNPRNSSYREEIMELSSIIAPSASLRAFLVITTDLSKDLANETIQELSMKQRGRQHITPARVMSLKRGHLLLPGFNSSIGYRSLLSFIQNGCEDLARTSLERFMDDDLFKRLSRERIDSENHKTRANHHGEEIHSESKLGVTQEEGAKIPKRVTCINGFKDLMPNYFPDPDNFRYVRSQIRLVCTCEECNSNE